MNHAHDILAQYSQKLPTKLTLAIKKSIIAAISPNFTDEQVIQKVQKTNWSDKQAITDLCKAKLASILTMERDAAIEEKREQLAIKSSASIERQLAKQYEGIAEQKIQRVPSLSYHTLIHKLSQRTSKAEYKFQMSWTPLFEDQEGLNHYAIEPYNTEKGEAKASLSYPLVVEHSIYDPTHIPIELLDIALN